MLDIYVLTLFLFICLAFCLSILLFREVGKQGTVHRTPRQINVGKEIDSTSYTLVIVAGMISYSIFRHLVIAGLLPLQSVFMTAAMIAVVVLYLIKREKVRSHQQSEECYSPFDEPTTLRDFQRRLFNMVGGEKEIAYRLVSYEKSRRPGRPEVYYWQSAIESLERDRR